MDARGQDEAVGWLAESIARVQAEPFPIVDCALRPVVERGDPWAARAPRAGFDLIARRLQADAVEGRRVVLVTDVEDDPAGRVQAAALLAQALRAEGIEVLLVDADVRHVGLSRWLSDAELEAEGFVDVLQYGASVAACLRPGPLEGTEILGVGSYRPDGASLLAEEDLRRLHAQLRSRAGVVLVVAPCWLPDERFHPLLVHADRTVVACHLDARLGERLEDLLEYLSGLAVPVAALVTFAGPDDSERRVDTVLGEPGAPNPPQEQDDAGASPVEPEPAAIEIEGGFRRADDDQTSSSSAVFRWVLASVAVVLVAFVGWWASTQRGASPPVRPLPMQNAPRTVASPPPDPAGPTLAEAQTEDAAGTDLPPSGDPSPGGEQEAAQEPSTDGARDEASTVRVEERPDAPPPTPSGAAVETAPPGAAEEDPLRRTPGAGWALHLFSFPDSSDAVTSAAGLARRGYASGVRGFDHPDGGRWYRVLIGRFDSRSAALAAREPLAAALRLEWVGAVRVDR